MFKFIDRYIYVNIQSEEFDPQNSFEVPSLSKCLEEKDFVMMKMPCLGLLY
jgi:hypothetical protein